MIFRDLSRCSALPLPLLTCATLLLGCAVEQGDMDEGDAAIEYVDSAPTYVFDQATKYFSPLPGVIQNSRRPVSEAKYALGRQLFFDPRLSKNQDLSCNSCHDLNGYGVDIRPASGKTSLGHRGQRGVRNAPTVYNAALHVAQFWDGRAVDVEEQAKGPILNAVEMALPNAAAVVAVVKSIPGYAPLFTAAFPGRGDPITYDNLAIAIGAFERKLVTEDRFDLYLQGDESALTEPEKQGLDTFMSSGCPACHAGPGIGGAEYQKLGMLKTYPTTDLGRYEVTKKAADRYLFKVPSLRNIAKTAPYFHDGSQPTLEAAVKTMAEYQTVQGALAPEEVSAIVTFLKSLTGELPTSYIVAPPPLASGPTTPRPNPN
jgi:cytochrome c peroxidase